MKRRIRFPEIQRLALAMITLALLAITAVRAGNRNAWPLPEDRGTAGTLAALQKLPVYMRVLQTTAHPDDESAGTLAWLSRKIHARTALFSLTRGEGGQNILGNEKYEAMGLLRTGELLEACKYYGVELYFSTAFDFGFSKTAAETLSKWGHDEILGEMVRFIRTWRPTIIISKFEGSPRDGHGHHQAAGILTNEAWQAAGDPTRFPEHFKLGLAPWKPKKLYHGSVGVRPEGESTQGAAGRDNTDWTVRVPIGDYDPVLGRSYREIGTEGYSKHRSQGNGAAFSLPGRVYDYYKLVDSSVGLKAKEMTFFASIDTSLSAIAELAGADKAAVALLANYMSGATRLADEALQAFQALDPARSAAKVAEGVAVLHEAIQKVESSQLPKPGKDSVLDALREKLADFENAASAALGIYVVARAEAETGVPGQSVPVTAYFFNRGSEEVDLKRVSLRIPEGWTSALPANAPLGKVASGGSAVFRFTAGIDPGAHVTEPFWYRENPRRDRYQTRPTKDIFAPFGPPEISASAAYGILNTEISISEPACAQTGDPIRGADFNDFQVVPTLSVMLTPDLIIAPISPSFQDRELQASILNNARSGAQGTVKISAPSGWRVSPSEMQFSLREKGETYTGRFSVRIPPGTPAGSFTVEAVASEQGREFRRGYRIISYQENWTRRIYTESRAAVEVFDVKVAPRLTVGYIMGAGDDVPAAVEQLGVRVQMLGGADLAFGDLSRFDVIVIGIRAYNVNEALKANNQRLLKYVENGGRLIVQYNTPLRVGPGRNDSPFPYGPYSMTNSTADRITVEDSPLRMLDPQNPILNVLNKITPADFQGWVQERGLYFIDHWDPHYTALLSGNDPGEEPKNGGMLITRYGKGWYIYTAYSWFRQLPAGVPGAFRIFSNMLGAGR